MCHGHVVCDVTRTPINVCREATESQGSSQAASYPSHRNIDENTRALAEWMGVFYAYIMKNVRSVFYSLSGSEYLLRRILFKC